MLVRSLVHAIGASVSKMRLYRAQYSDGFWGHLNKILLQRLRIS